MTNPDNSTPNASFEATSSSQIAPLPKKGIENS